jgi:hypothetical protein
MLLMEDIGRYFHNAREYFLEKDLYASAIEIRQGSSMIKLEAASAKGDAKEDLMASVSELAELASDIEKGNITSAKKLNDAFARANHALAVHYHQKAAEYWEQEDAEKSGYALSAAASSLERAAAWSGEQLESGTMEVIDGTRLIAGSLIQGTGWTIGTVGKGVSFAGRTTGKAIGLFGRGIAFVGRETGEAVAGVAGGTGKVVKGVAGGTGKAVTGVTGGVGEAVGAVGKGAGGVVEDVTGGTGKAIQAVGTGVGWVPQEVGNSIEDIGDEIEKLGKAVEPAKK